MQTVSELLALKLLPARAAATAAVVLQALIFGVLHSYTDAPTYLLTAAAAGLAFGGAYAATRNLFVPVVAHFAVDLLAFLVCHVQVWPHVVRISSPCACSSEVRVGAGLSGGRG